MTKQTGMIITIVVAVLALCCSVTCCPLGIYTLVEGEYVFDLDAPINSIAGFSSICLGVLVWAVPLLLWIFLVRGKDDDVAL
jgi:hypothetical protein